MARAMWPAIDISTKLLKQLKENKEGDLVSTDKDPPHLVTTNLSEEPSIRSELIRGRQTALEHLPVSPGESTPVMECLTDQLPSDLEESTTMQGVDAPKMTKAPEFGNVVTENISTQNSPHNTPSSLSIMARQKGARKDKKVKGKEQG
ncbi:hypothetical protein K2173_011069 [Erythroxylum novogranatense]|uniref:Uncharacterized protein n=1 Tax=Erythroxylum novogranatense TaxID=1862640 RepID=A0AAV8TKE7_9ROSI|nr:hypothetical protein K2173_011069 [Erythroxylum novogranatense]